MIKLPMEVWVCKGTDDLTELGDLRDARHSNCSQYIASGKATGGKCGLKGGKCDARKAVIEWVKEKS